MRNRHQEQRNSGGGGRSRGRIREVGREVSGAAVRLNYEKRDVRGVRRSIRREWLIGGRGWG